MNIKQLRNEVQSLRDELAIMQRKYEDILNNLDVDNFSSRFTKEQGKMRTAIEVTAEGIKTKVSKEELKAYSTIEQTAEHIQNIVSKGAMLDTAKEIPSLDKATDTSKIYVIRERDDDDNILSETYYYFNDITKNWEVLSGDNIYTVFEQTPEGFKLKGNVKIDGSCILTDSLTFDSSDNPLQVEYSVDGIKNWHSTFASDSDKFMRLKIGANWSDAMKIVGSDGKDGKDGQDGWDGSDATVTPQAVFNALTDNGANQGIFAAFVKNGNQIYINAEYLATKIADVAEDIYIGDYSTQNQRKHIYFNNQANIYTFDNNGLGQTAIGITASGIQFATTPDKIEFVKPGGGSITYGAITLAEYLEEYGGGSGGTATAVFG